MTQQTQPPVKKGVKPSTIIFAILAACVLSTAITFGTLYLLKQGLKSASRTFQFDVDAASAHAELKEYYNTHRNSYPSNDQAPRLNKFTYEAMPAGCDNSSLDCIGYTITHTDYNKSETNIDYAKRQKN